MDNDFLLKLISVFAGLTTLILGILAWNKDRFKIRIDNDTMKRKEVSEVLQKIYNDLKEEMKLQKKEHQEEIARIREEHRNELLAEKKESALELEKRDAIIHEIVQLLPIQHRMEIEKKIININNTTL